MSFCKNCGHENDDDAKFCTRCGQAVTSRAPTAPEVPVERTGSYQGVVTVTNKGFSWKRVIGGVVTVIAVLVVISIVVATVITWGDDDQDYQVADFIAFGTDRLEGSQELALSGIRTQFDSGVDVWMRLQLSEGFGTTEVKFFLEKRGELGGWSSVDSWVIDTDPEYGVLLSSRPEMMGLDSGRYKVFVATNDVKRAEGEFTIGSGQ